MYCETEIRWVSDAAMAEARRIDNDRSARINRNVFANNYKVCPVCAEALYRRGYWLRASALYCGKCGVDYEIYGDGME